MKLELKHLAPYLPYGITGKSKRGTVYYLGLNNNMLGKGIETRDISSWLNKGFIPALRPLSDLKTEKYCGFSKDWDLELIESLGWGTTLEVDGGTTHWGLEGNYRLFEGLFMHHFDVFGLIEKGLAIDINTI